MVIEHQGGGIADLLVRHTVGAKHTNLGRLPNLRPGLRIECEKAPAAKMGSDRSIGRAEDDCIHPATYPDHGARSDVFARRIASESRRESLSHTPRIHPLERSIVRLDRIEVAVSVSDINHPFVYDRTGAKWTGRRIYSPDRKRPSDGKAGNLRGVCERPIVQLVSAAQSIVPESRPVRPTTHHG